MSFQKLYDTLGAIVALSVISCVIFLFVSNWFNSVAYTALLFIIIAVIKIPFEKQTKDFHEVKEYSNAIDNWKWQDALEILEKAFQNPKNKKSLEQILLNLAPICAYLELPEKTLSYLNNINLPKNKLSTYAGVKYSCLIRSGRTEEADKFRHTFIEKNKNNNTYKYIIDYLYLLEVEKMIYEKRYDKAIDFLKSEEHKEIFISNIYSYYYKIYKSKDNKEQAIECMKKSIAKDEFSLHRLLKTDELLNYIRNNN